MKKEETENLLRHKDFLEKISKVEKLNKRSLYEASDSELKILLYICHWIASKQIPISACISAALQKKRKVGFIIENFSDEGKFQTLLKEPRSSHLKLAEKLKVVLPEITRCLKNERH